jgi:hypothetical protein
MQAESLSGRTLPLPLPQGSLLTHKMTLMHSFSTLSGAALPLLAELPLLAALPLLAVLPLLAAAPLPLRLQVCPLLRDGEGGGSRWSLTLLTA